MELSLKDAVENFVGVDGVSVKGTIKGIYPYKTGVGQYGKYSFQDVKVEQDGFTAIFNLGNREQLTDNDIGKEIRANSVYKNGAMTGVKVADVSYTNKEGVKVKKIAIKINKGADVKVADEFPPDDSHPTDQDFGEIMDEPEEDLGAVMDKIPDENDIAKQNKLGILDEIIRHLQEKRMEIAES